MPEPTQTPASFLDHDGSGSGNSVGLPAPYYADDLVTLYHADCREILPSLSRGDLLLTDPPYNVGKDYGGHDDAMSPAEYEAWTVSWFTLARAVTRRAVVFPGHGNLGMWWRVEKPSAVGCWYKPGNAGSSIIGFEEWEPWLYWHGGDKGLLGGSSVIRATTGRQLDTGNHPCPKPLGLMARLLGKCRAGAVVDPFVGSGTTLVAAKAQGIPAVGIELNERYCETAAQRLAQDVIHFDVDRTPPDPSTRALVSRATSTSTAGAVPARFDFGEAS